jgi:branched-chain amino acid transport system permease protein
MTTDATSPAQDIALLGTTRRRLYFVIALAILIMLPFRASPFLLDLANQVLFACIGALALMLLTGYAGQISLGTAGLLAAGAYSVGILVREVGAPFWITLPAAAVVGARWACTSWSSISVANTRRARCSRPA